MRYLGVALLLGFVISTVVQGQVASVPDMPSGTLQENNDQLRDALLESTRSKQGYAVQDRPADFPPLQVDLPIQQITFRYLEKTPIEPVNGEKTSPTQYKYRMIYAHLDINCDLDKIELTGDGKRAAVQAITAARHKKLLENLKDAKTEAEKVDAAKKLEENYRAHYAVETAWREERIAELEKRIEDMRSQVKERATSEDKYVEAAMTLAKLHAQGIAAEPPKLDSPSAGQAGFDASEFPPTLPVGPSVSY